MAIKITGTTVINDSRGLENITDITQTIRKPEVLSPTANETDVDFGGLTIEGSGFAAVFGGRDYREFQVDLATGDFSSPVVSQQVNSDSVTLTTDLAGDTEHKVRIRDVDLDGNTSEFSDVVNFTTAVNPFTQGFGTAAAGGFYMGTIAAAGTTYYLIVAPNATGCACCEFKTSQTGTSGTCSLVDGYANTYPALENSTHPAGNWTATRTIGGFSDWYLPAIDELEVFYNNGGGDGPGDPLPSGEDFDASEYWASTNGAGQSEPDNAYSLYFFSGGRYAVNQTFPRRVRAVRRVPI